MSIPATINGLPVTSIGYEAFRGGIMTSLTIPGSVASIGVLAFYDCSGLTNVTISNGVTSIGSSAFSETALETVILPDSMTSIDPRRFKGVRI